MTGKQFTATVRCSHCQFENLPGVQLCQVCGSHLADIVCHRCGFSNPAGYAFCGVCPFRKGMATVPWNPTGVDHPIHGCFFSGSCVAAPKRDPGPSYTHCRIRHAFLRHLVMAGIFWVIYIGFRIACPSGVRTGPGYYWGYHPGCWWHLDAADCRARPRQ